MSQGRFDAWWGQWWKVKTGWELLLAYEKKHNKLHTFILRIRPDLLFFQPMPLNFIATSKNEIVIPNGIAIVKNRTSMNDHMAFCSRSACQHYFTILTLAIPIFFRLGEDDGGALLRSHLTKHMVPLRWVDVTYTIMRPCSANNDCWRLKNSLQETHCKRAVDEICGNNNNKNNNKNSNKTLFM